MKKILIGIGSCLVLAAIFAGFFYYVQSRTMHGADGTYVSIGKTIVLNGMTLHLIDVVGDSRCPVGAQCVWPGKLSARVELNSQKTGSTDITIDSDATTKLGDYVISIVDIQPAKTSSAPIDKAAYLIKFSAFY